VVAPLAFEAIKGRLKGDGKAGRWYSPLRLYVLPALAATSSSVGKKAASSKISRSAVNPRALSVAGITKMRPR
jgi:hypothetical protein